MRGGEEHLRILLLEDSVAQVELVEQELKRGRVLYQLRRVQDREAFEGALKTFAPHLIIADYDLPGFDGMSALQIVLEQSPETPVIMSTGTIGGERAAETLKMGATDYVLKDQLHRLVPSIHRAIAEAKEREQRRRSEQRYRELFDGVPLGLFRSTASGRILDANPALAAILGHDSVKSLLRENASDFYVDPDARVVLTERLKREGVIRDHELHLRRRDGNVIRVSASIRLVCDADRAPLFFEGSLQDVTQERTAEKSLRESEERYRTLFEGVPVGIYRVTPDGKLLEGNEALARMLGFSSIEAMKGAPIVSLYVEPTDRERWRNQLERAGTLEGYEIRHVRANGEIIWVRDTARVVRDDRGHALYYEGTLQDVTQEKRAAEEIRFQASLLDQVRSAVMATDMQGNITYWNHLAEVLYGYKRHEALGRNVMNVTVSAEGGQAAQAIMDGVASYGFWEGEFRVRRKDGTTFPSYVYLQKAVGQDGKPAGFVSISSDITDRKRREEELRDSIAMLRRTDDNRRKLLARLISAEEEERKRIASDIHDDSLQIMTAASLRLGTLRKTLGDPGSQEAVQRVEETVRQSIVRLRTLMFELRPAALDRDGLAAALELYAGSPQGDGGPSFEVEDRLTHEIDQQARAILYRIAQEALSNVRKHARASRVHILLDGNERAVRVRIEDDGVGFSPNLEDSSQPGHLGLDSMRERAEMAGGFFRMQSTPGKGTVVEFGLPLPRVPAPTS